MKAFIKKKQSDTEVFYKIKVIEKYSESKKLLKEFKRKQSKMKVFLKKIQINPKVLYGN